MYIVIEKKADVIVDGVRKEEWQEYYRPWVDVKSLYGKELYQALSAKLENVLNFETRYCKKIKNLNTKNYRIVWEDRYFNIIHVDYGIKINKRVTIKAKEVV
ncbi:MAG: head-tail adaptor protein [Lachnospiraceae bacterium]|nr:head-tail adaptor protein [Lachnospiraceae bacterium]